MLEYYIHQIGDISDSKTYNRLNSIIDTKGIYSRKKLEEMGIVHSYENSSFKLDIPPKKAYMYYTDDIHFDRVSLSDPNNRFVKKPHTQKMTIINFPVETVTLMCWPILKNSFY